MPTNSKSTVSRQDTIKAAKLIPGGVTQATITITVSRAGEYQDINLGWQFNPPVSRGKHTPASEVAMEISKFLTLRAAIKGAEIGDHGVIGDQPVSLLSAE